MQVHTNWQDWVRGTHDKRGQQFVSRALAVLVGDDAIDAVWISGSRATGRFDCHSDTDIRIHAPHWTDEAMRRWLTTVSPSGEAWVRLSKLAGALLNYECLFERVVAIDLLVFTGSPPEIPADSVALKVTAPLTWRVDTGVIKETAIEPVELRNLMHGLLIDQRKFAKLASRHDSLGAIFLLEAQRFALLRLAYIVASGVDCGPKATHTLASFKLVRETIVGAGNPVLDRILAAIETEGAVAAGAKAIEQSIAPLFEELRRRFSQFLKATIAL